MPSNNSKYTPEFREQTARHIIESGKSATSMAEDLSIDVNTVCRWVREFRKKHDLPTWHDEKKRKTPVKSNKDEADLIWEKRSLEKKLKQQDRLIANLREEKEILKKSLAIFAQPHA
jgi:transposase-like protein